MTTNKGGQPPRGLQVLLNSNNPPPRTAVVNLREGTYVIERVSQKHFQIVACAGKNYVPDVQNVDIESGESSKKVDLNLVFAEGPDNRQTLNGIVKDATIKKVYAWAYECQLAETDVNPQHRWEFVNMPKPPNEFAYDVRTQDGKRVK